MWVIILKKWHSDKDSRFDSLCDLLEICLNCGDENVLLEICLKCGEGGLGNAHLFALIVMDTHALFIFDDYQ